MWKLENYHNAPSPQPSKHHRHHNRWKYKIPHDDDDDDADDDNDDDNDDDDADPHQSQLRWSHRLRPPSLHLGLRAWNSAFCVGIGSWREAQVSTCTRSEQDLSLRLGIWAYVPRLWGLSTSGIYVFGSELTSLLCGVSLLCGRATAAWLTDWLLSWRISWTTTQKVSSGKVEKHKVHSLSGFFNNWISNLLWAALRGTLRLTSGLSAWYIQAWLGGKHCSRRACAFQYATKLLQWNNSCF